MKTKKNMESMNFKKNFLTKSEIVSLAFSHHIKADQIMLDDETGTSKSYLRITNWLYSFITVIYKKINDRNINTLDDLILRILSNIDNASLVIFAKKGYLINKVFKISKNLQLFAFVDNKKIISQNFFMLNCLIFLTKKFLRIMKKFIFNNIKENMKLIFESLNSILLVNLAYPGFRFRVNTLSYLNKFFFYRN